jgi:Zn-dependent protease
MNAAIATLSILILLLSVIIHEVMHGLVALKFGDHTAENAGRLTLNPIPHIDPIGTILLPLVFLILPLLTGAPVGFFIAWAKPVPINPLNFTDIKKGELWVSAAGILSNFSLAIIAAVLYHLLGPANLLLSEIFRFAVGINLMLGIFNLLPIAPLDGSKVLLTLLPLDLAREYQKTFRYGFLILLALLYFNVIGRVLSAILLPIFSILGVPFI